MISNNSKSRVFKCSTRRRTHGILLYFSFSRISSAVIPLASSFFSTVSASTFLAASAAFASAAAFLASSLVSSFWAALSAVFFSFRSAFKVSMLAVMEVIYEVRETIDSFFSVIWDAKSLVAFGLFLLPLVLGIRYPPFFINLSSFPHHRHINHMASQIWKDGCDVLTHLI